MFDRGFMCVQCCLCILMMVEVLASGRAIHCAHLEYLVRLLLS